MLSDSKQQYPHQLYPAQIVLLMLGTTALLVHVYSTVVYVIVAWGGPHRFYPLFWLGLILLALGRSERLFPQDEPTLSPETIAALRQRGIRRAYRVGFWVALAYAIGAIVAAQQVPARQLALIGGTLTLLVGITVSLWTNRRGTALPV